MELKYKTSNFPYVDAFAGALTLKDHGAQDLGLYDFLWDVYRLEQFCKDSKVDRGFAVFVTNDYSYKNDVKRQKSNANQFRLPENRLITGSLAWGNPDAGSLGSRLSEFKLYGQYSVNWVDIEGTHFSFLIFEVLRP